MKWRRVLIASRGVAAGWCILFSLTYLIERPLLAWTAPLFGIVWIATAQLALHCLVMAAAGWSAGRLNRTHAVTDVVAFAVTLSFWNLGGALLIDVPWLLRLAADAFRDPSYLDSLLTTAATQAFLFGCLFAGGLLSRPRPPVTSILGPRFV